jgi:hypothetical protein
VAELSKLDDLKVLLRLVRVGCFQKLLRISMAPSLPIIAVS